MVSGRFVGLRPRWPGPGRRWFRYSRSELPSSRALLLGKSQQHQPLGHLHRDARATWLRLATSDTNGGFGSSAVGNSRGTVERTSRDIQVDVKASREQPESSIRSGREIIADDAVPSPVETAEQVNDNTKWLEPIKRKVEEAMESEKRNYKSDMWTDFIVNVVRRFKDNNKREDSIVALVAGLFKYDIFELDDLKRVSTEKAEFRNELKGEGVPPVMANFLFENVAYPEKAAADELSKIIEARGLSDELFDIAVDELAPYTDREQAIGVIQDAARTNFKMRVCDREDTAQLTFVNCPGHVRVGKTRTGQQAPKIIKDHCETNPGSFDNAEILDPIRIFISFKNGASFNPEIDGNDKKGLLWGLGGRLLGAYEGLQFISMSKPANPGALHPALVFARILKVALKGKPEESVLPVVVHFDEYGHFVDELKTAGFSYEAARNRFKEMLYALAPIMGCYDETGVLKPFRGRYFVLPISTGTSFVDVSVGLSQHAQKTTTLPLLGYNSSKKVVRQMLQRSLTVEKVDSIMNNPSFRIALGDTGGFPGFLGYLWGDEAQDNTDYVSLVKRGVKRYISDAEKPDGWSLIVQLAIARVSVPISFQVTENATIGDMRDRGVVHLVPSKDDSMLFTVYLAPTMMGRWNAPIKAGSVVPDVDERSWQWYRFEDCILDYFQALLSALHTMSTKGLLTSNEPGVATLSEILPGATFSPESLGTTRLRLSQICGRGLQKNDKWIFSHDNRALEAINRESRDVFKTAVNNPHVDGYVTLEKADSNETFTLFLQMRHSQLTTENANIGIPAMNALKGALDLRLQGDDYNWGSDDYALVFVSNRRVQDSPIVLAENVLLISRDKMEGFMGKLAYRGLLHESAACDGDDAN